MVQRCGNLVDLDKRRKMTIQLQKLVPIQPRTSNILPKFCQKLATTLRVRRAALRGARGGRGVHDPRRPGLRPPPRVRKREKAVKAAILTSKSQRDRKYVYFFFLCEKEK